jgi:hypothetical protein
MIASHEKIPLLLRLECPGFQEEQISRLSEFCKPKMIPGRRKGRCSRHKETERDIYCLALLSALAFSNWRKGQINVSERQAVKAFQVSSDPRIGFAELRCFAVASFQSR